MVPYRLLLNKWQLGTDEDTSREALEVTMQGLKAGGEDPQMLNDFAGTTLPCEGLLPAAEHLIES